MSFSLGERLRLLVQRRKHSLRYYRNWAIRALVWFLVLVPIWFIIDSAWHLLWGIPVYMLWMVTSQVFGATHPRRDPFSVLGDPADLDFPCQRVSLRSRDGLELSGWYKPGPKRAAIIVLHGVVGSGVHMAQHGEALSSRGYAVLLLDLRAHGRSEGDTSAWGWTEVDDVLGAVDFLGEREDVDPERIGVLGVSLGAQVGIRAAIHSGRIRAVAAEGPSEVAWSDKERPHSLGGWIEYPVRWLTYVMQSFMSGVPQPPGLLVEVPKIGCPLLLIAPDRENERRWVKRCFEVAPEPKDLWEVPGAAHAQALFAARAEYTDRVATFFDEAMGIGAPAFARNTSLEELGP